jgi:hypothetical protein
LGRKKRFERGEVKSTTAGIWKIICCECTEKARADGTSATAGIP